MPAERSEVPDHRRARNRSRTPAYQTVDPRLGAVGVACGAASNDLAVNASDTEQSRQTVAPEPIAEPTSINSLALTTNANWNSLSGIGNIVNNNPNVNFHSSPGASLHYAPINNFNMPVPSASEVIQTKISAALKERHVPSAVYDAQLGKGCMEGTRVQILRDIENWILSPKGQQIFWLAGMAGTGKSAIAWTVCSRIRAHGKILLGGSFFCSRSTGLLAQRDVRCVIPTLSQLLARQSMEFSEALAAELARDPDILLKHIEVQAKQLLYVPLLSLQDSELPIVFVIDALDECGGQMTSNSASDDAETHRIVSEVLEALVDFTRSSKRLPVKFLVTSRPETHIRDTPVSDSTFSTVLRLHTVNKEQVTADIRLYVSTRLSSSPKLLARFTDNDADVLAELCDGLFIVATTALQYILGTGVDRALIKFRTLLNCTREGLSTGAAVPLDRMYALILDDAARISETEMEDLSAMLQLLGVLLSARMTLSVTALADLMDTPKENIRADLSRLHSVIHVPDDDIEPGLRTLHASFGDYLFARAPSRLRISESLGHGVLARGCLHVMAKCLYFGISQSRSSYQPNSPTKPHSITLSLEYACLQWVYHVASLSDVTAFDDDIENIFCARFLFWLEVMSVLGKVLRAIAMLVLAAATTRSAPLAHFLRDANAFVASSRDAIERSAPHIYLSALPFSFKDSLVYRTFAPLCAGLISVETFGIDRHGGHLIMTLTGHNHCVKSVAYSPDGRLVASGSLDDTVRIWDTRTGEETMPPLRSGDGDVWSVTFALSGGSLAAGTENGTVCIWSPLPGRPELRRLSGHLKRIWSVVFSPDSTLLASASVDKTIRLWKTTTGQQIAVLQGHTRPVTTVVFSPNGAILASGSQDQTIRLWHVTTCKPAGHPIQGPDKGLFSIAISPDGTKLASGGAGESIQLWDVQAGLNVATLAGHARSVRCVQFSPDGNSLVSASDDHTIRLWTVPKDGSEAQSIVLDGHTDHVRAVCFSPDGLNISSASDDRIIRIWSAGSGQKVVESLPAHENSIRSAAASADGTFIVSGSNDRTVRIWDANTALPVHNTPMEHTMWVLSVSISPDGCLIASASKDCTVRLWNAQTEEPVGDVLVGHEGPVNTVSFSPSGQCLASGSDDRTVRIWNAATGCLSNSAPLPCAGTVYTVAFSPCGKFLAAGDSLARIYIWHTDTSLSVCEPLDAHESPVCSVCFSPDGSRIVSGSGNSKIRIWDVSTRMRLLDLEGHTDWVSSVAISPNGQFVCSSSDDKTVRLWDASSGAQVALLHGHTARISSVVFSADGRSIVSASDDTTIRVWDVEEARVISSSNGFDPETALSSANLKGGWLVGPSGELLLWVPSEYRSYLHVSPCKMLIGRHRITVSVGSGGWNRGDSWTSCWRNDINPVSSIM